MRHQQGQTPATQKSKLDFAQILHKALGFLQYGRLFGVLACIGMLGGVILYAYSRPLYYSRSVLQWQLFGLPFHEDSESADVRGTRGVMWRELKMHLESDQLFKQVAERLGAASPGEDVEAIRGRIPIARILFRDAQTLLIEVFAFNPQLVRDYPEALIQVYQENQSKNRQEYRAKAVAKYLDEMEQLRQKIDDELSKRLTLEKDRDLASLTVQQQKLLKLPTEIEQARAKIQRMEQIRADFQSQSQKLDIVAKLALLSAFDREWSQDDLLKAGEVVRRQAGSTPIMPDAAKMNVDVVVKPDVAEGSDPWRDMEKQLRTVNEELRQKSDKFLPGHEVIRKLNEEKSHLEQMLEAELQTATSRFELEYQRVKQKLPDLEAQWPVYYETLQKYEKFVKDYNLLEKGQQDWNTAYAELAKRIAAIQFGESKDRVEFMFQGYEALEDRNPISPNPKKSVMAALALSLLMGLSVPLLLEFTNTTVLRIPQMESRLGLLGLGIVPLADKSWLEEIHRSPALGAKVPNFLLECFRIIRSNIILNPGREKRSQAVMVSSALPSEGKSTLAANLAWAFYSMGERTLLVDTDLRRGRLHQIVEVDNSLGLASYFAGKATAEQLPVRTKEKNLDVVPRGPFIPGASEFLCREVFEQLMEKWRKEYDRIVLDGPPVLGLSETPSIQRVTDGVMLVVRAENTKMMDVESAVEQLRRAGAAFFGFVLNRLDLSKRANHYYYYYYSPYYYSNEIGEGDEPGAASPVVA